MDYIIVGDTKRFDSCLIYICGTKERAEENLHRMLNNPTDHDLHMMEGHSNIRIKATEDKYCWWKNYPLD